MNQGVSHSRRYGHKNETPISQNFVFIIKFQSCINPYDVSKMFQNALSHLFSYSISSIFRLIYELEQIHKVKQPMFELILRAPRSKQVLVYSRFYISQNLLSSQFFFHMVGFCGFCTIEGNVNGEFEEKSEKLKFSIQNG